MKSLRQKECFKSWNRISKEDNKGNYATVVELCKEHLKFYPKHVPTIILLPDSYVHFGEYRNAERLLEKAGKLWTQKMRLLFSGNGANWKMPGAITRPR